MVNQYSNQTLPFAVIKLISSCIPICTIEDIPIINQLQITTLQDIEEQYFIEEYLIQQEVEFHNTLGLDPVAEYRYRTHKGCLHGHIAQCNYGDSYCFYEEYFEDYDREDFHFPHSPQLEIRKYLEEEILQLRYINNKLKQKVKELTTTIQTIKNYNQQILQIIQK